ncbi:histone-fold-containing protein [Rhodocollybia butyracea]|uniref:DNA polymerase epsilon subunit D n=1 Tax=Rhodocollybia butyracea TaxID=206335 RepID=A0A9P5PQE2_9AGAR|nr:histone-fold-containing protein [Rhodocollybia butyracea]
MPRKENPGPLSAQQQQDLVSEGIDNFELPKSLVTKIAKSAVPDNTKLQKEAILSLVKGSTVFINYLAATAHDVAQSKQHKSISASDVLKALELIELGDLVDPLTAELQVYRDQVKPDKSGARRASTASSNQRPQGKEKANGAGPSASVGGASATAGTETFPPPFTSAPLAQPVAGSAGLSTQQSPDASESISAAFNRTADAAEGDEMEVDVEADDAVMEEEEVDEGAEEEEDEPEELQDMVAVEAQEVLEDAMGVEQRGAATEHRS